jgi:hypothetical protein
LFQKLTDLKFTESQIQSLAPDDASMKAGKGLSGKNHWLTSGYSERALWGEIKGSGSKPYQTQVDIHSLAFKCSCPSRKFPCKHGIGLMLLWANDPNAVMSGTETSWVKEWMDKRVAKTDKPTEPKSISEEDIIKAEKSKQKRADDRMLSVQAGVDEIKLWIADLIRTGIIQLQQKDFSFFAKTAARMVDAKAPGLASWVKSLAKINYSAGSHTWQNEVLTILAKMHLLTHGFAHLQDLPEHWQHSVRSLIGWNQSPKDLLADASVSIVNDTWIVTGQETTTEEDIIIQRTWLLGIREGRSALLLNFGNRFAPLDISVVNGSVIEAGLAYFPSAWPQRAVIKIQQKIMQELPGMPPFLDDFTALYGTISDTISQYPFANDILCAIRSVRPFHINGKYQALDHHGYIMDLHPDFHHDKIINWLAMSGGDFFDMSVVVRNHLLIPLGIFMDQKYMPI